MKLNNQIIGFNEKPQTEVFQKTSKQLFDLSYRAICIEYHSMQSIVNLLTLLKKNIDNSLDTQTQISRQIGINSQIFFMNSE